MNNKEKKQKIADAIKNFDYSIFGEWRLTIKGYASILRHGILLSSDEQFLLFVTKLQEYEQTIYDIIDGKSVELEFKEAKEKEYFNQAVSLLKHISPERKEVLKQFIKRILDVLRDEAQTEND